VLSDPVGNAVTHVTVAGWFRNIAGVPMADFYWTPETPIVKETITFTSTSTDDDAIVEWDWDFGDKKSGSGETTTHYYGKAGDYTVTLTVTDDEGKVDSFFDVVTVLPKPGPKGATILKTAATHHIVDYSQYGEKKTVLKVWIKNLNPLDKTTVRVIFKVYDAAAMQHLGSIVQIGIMGPTSKDLFAADFWFSEWSFHGPEMAYLIVVTLDYQDGWIGEQPNWVEVPEQGYISIHVVEKAPVLVYSWTDLGGCSMLLDASASYDPDEKWGDAVVYYEWRIYDPDVVFYNQVFGPTVTYTFSAPYSNVMCRIYIRDSFGAQQMATFYVTVTP
jgi:PKD repeat protein